jgi:hypothetical protein
MGLFRMGLFFCELLDLLFLVSGILLTILPARDIMYMGYFAFNHGCESQRQVSPSWIILILPRIKSCAL